MKTRSEKVYVKVNVDCDSKGYMTPKAITWSDGRIFIIEKVKDHCPNGKNGERYSIVVHGEKRNLFFEKANEQFKQDLSGQTIWQLKSDRRGDLLHRRFTVEFYRQFLLRLHRVIGGVAHRA